jgi:flagellar biogenesis protein FliO
MKGGDIVNGLSLEKSKSLGDAALQPDLWRWALSWWQSLLRISRRAPRRLRLCESLPLGDRRFVAVVEFDQARFLVGGTPASLVLLARLESNRSGVSAPIVNEPGDSKKERR